MKPIEGQVILITGATDGIGRATALELARLGAHVLLHGRDAARLDEVRGEVMAIGAAIEPGTYRADFAGLEDVRALARSIGDDHERLDVLINNAGIGRGRSGARRREVSADGHELRFQVNYLAPFLLTRLLLPPLERAAPARVVHVSSIGQTAIDFDDVMLERGYDGIRAYCQSKLAMVLDAITLAETLDPARVCVNAVHPGTLLDTKMVREGFGAPRGPVEIGVRSLVHAATADALDGVSGKFLDRTSQARADAQAYDAEARAALLRISESLSGLAPRA